MLRRILLASAGAMALSGAAFAAEPAPAPPPPLWSGFSFIDLAWLRKLLLHNLADFRRRYREEGKKKARTDVPLKIKSCRK